MPPDSRAKPAIVTRDSIAPFSQKDSARALDKDSDGIPCQVVGKKQFTQQSVEVRLAVLAIPQVRECSCHFVVGAFRQTLVGETLPSC